jgi:hypothetical protein
MKGDVMVTPLRQRMIEDMRIRNFAESTQDQYVGRVAAFAKHFGRSPEQLGLEEIRAFQVHLAKSAFHNEPWMNRQQMSAAARARSPS